MVLSSVGRSMGRLAIRSGRHHSGN